MLTAHEVASMKEEALVSLGRLLPEYTILQEHYSSHVHLPDYRAFSREWEESLYRPIRDAIRSATDNPNSPQNALLYCAPGPHAPLLHEDGAPSLASRFTSITFLDIDAAALRCAKNNVRDLAQDVPLEGIVFDFTGPFGQRLCDVYSDALSLDDLVSITEKLSKASVLSSSIFFDLDAVLSRLCTQLDLASGCQRYTYSVSEMVASFTGTAVWLAFRSVLYQRFSITAPQKDLESCLQAATLLWQSYNQCFLVFHLEFLRQQLTPKGSVLLVFDTRKVYDNPEQIALSAFLPRALLVEMLQSCGFQVSLREMLSWRDHPCGYEITLYGIPVSDFEAHMHEVELYYLEVAS